MRMWLIEPKKLCRQHLLGEHNELHMLVGCLVHNKNIKGFIDKKRIQLNKVVDRHIELVKEMERRGYNHQSPMPLFMVYKMPPYFEAGDIDVSKNIQDLRARCSNCEV